ncbi:MAG: hypothetical protein ABIZ56_08400 [Chthoniobacteraceae bacterium]
MSTLVEIEKAIESLSERDVEELATRLQERRMGRNRWPVPPPDVPKEEIRRIQAEIDAVFSSVEGDA